MASLGVKVLSDSVQVWRALKGLTSGVARVVVQSVEGENGFEAWRRLHHQFEPKLVIKQGQVLSDFAAMVMKPARTIAETRDIITELDRKMKLIRELTDEGVSDVHAKSILIGILDSMTRHTASKQSDQFEAFKDAVLEFTNAAVSMSVPRRRAKVTQCRSGVWEQSSVSGARTMDKVEMGSPHLRKRISGQLQEVALASPEVGDRVPFKRQGQRTPVDGTGNAQGRLQRKRLRQGWKGPGVKGEQGDHREWEGTGRRMLDLMWATLHQ